MGKGSVLIGPRPAAQLLGDEREDKLVHARDVEMDRKFDQVVFGARRGPNVRRPGHDASAAPSLGASSSRNLIRWGHAPPAGLPIAAEQDTGSGDGGSAPAASPQTFHSCANLGTQS
jgi:hypothetical protein